MKKSLSPLSILTLLLCAFSNSHIAWATLKPVPLPTHLSCFGQLKRVAPLTTEEIPPQPNEIGRGEMSVITKEKDGDRWIAVKRMNDDPSYTEKDWAKIKSATELAQELHARWGDDSPMVNVHSFEQHGNSATIKMEYLEGDNLRMHLQKLFLREGLNEKSIAIALDLASSAAHSVDLLGKSKILNPDLKAANMVVTKNKNGATVVKMVDPESLVRINPDTYGIDQFPIYVSAMSPEMSAFYTHKETVLRDGIPEKYIAMFGQSVGIPSMHFAFGLMIQAEILKPFRNAILMKEPLKPRVLNAVEELEKVVKKLLDPNPVSRYTPNEASLYIDRLRDSLRRP